MQEALPFLAIILDKKNTWVPLIIRDLSRGKRLDEALRNLAFPDFIQSQIYFAHQQGNLAEALLKTADQLQAEEDRKKEFKSLLTYPSFLLLMMMGMLLAMHFFLLPQMKSMLSEVDQVTHLALNFIEYGPLLMAMFIILLFLGVAYIRHYQKSKSAFAGASLLVRLPFVGSFFRHFYTYRFAQEWAGLLSSGLSMRRIVTIMQQEESSQLLKEMGHELEVGLLNGKRLDVILQDLPFFDDELSLVVMHAQKIGNMADSLDVYASQTLAMLNEKVKKAFQYIQPFLFLVIAALIVVIYGSMLMPMFSFMDQL